LGKWGRKNNAEYAENAEGAEKSGPSVAIDVV
jgi:hypothetical protein